MASLPVHCTLLFTLLFVRLSVCSVSLCLVFVIVIACAERLSLVFGVCDCDCLC
jgi:hypothetical protein